MKKKIRKKRKQQQPLKSQSESNFFNPKTKQNDNKNHAYFSYIFRIFRKPPFFPLDSRRFTYSKMIAKRTGHHPQSLRSLCTAYHGSLATPETRRINAARRKTLRFFMHQTRMKPEERSTGSSPSFQWPSKFWHDLRGDVFTHLNHPLSQQSLSLTFTLFRASQALHTISYNSAYTRTNMYIRQSVHTVDKRERERESVQRVTHAV